MLYRLKLQLIRATLGGPLVNNDAELIGINSFMEDGIGINYAVACNDW